MIKRLLGVVLSCLCLQVFSEPATIREDGTLVIDGKPVFPIGFHAENLEHVKEGISCGFNVVMGSGEWEMPQYDYASAKGVWIIAGDSYVNFRGAGEGINLSAREEAVINNFFARIRDQHGRSIKEALESFGKLPNVIGWGIGDEPEAKSTEVAEAAYEIVKSYIPNKIVVNISCDVRWTPCLLNTADVLIFDRYLLRGSAKDNTCAQTQNSLSDQLDYVIKTWAGKSCWYMPQIYQPSYWSLKPDELLQLQDLRAQCYIALQCGVKGLIFYSWQELGHTYKSDANGEQDQMNLTAEQKAQQMAMLKELVAELKPLGPVLCDGRPSRNVFVNWIKPGVLGPGSQRIRILEYYGKQYLILHNPLNEAVTGVALGPDVGHSNFEKTFTGKVIAGSKDITISKHPKGMVQFTIIPHGSGVVELTRTNLMNRLGE